MVIKNKFTVVVTPADEDEIGYTAEVPEMPGCVTEGDTLTELFANVADAIQIWQDAA